jgi:hypothetical protein
VGVYREERDATGIDGDHGSNAAPDAGAVYVFGGDGTTWNGGPIIRATNTGKTNCFCIVALSGDDRP